MSGPDLRPNPATPSPRGGFVAAAFVVIGLLILVPSGLCSAFFGVVTFFEYASEPDLFWNDLRSVLEFLAFAAAGALLVYWGRKMGSKPDK